MREIKYLVQEKQGRNYVDVHVCNNEKEVYKQLSHDLIAKKINCCTYIKSIKRVNNYDGTINVTVMYSNNVRRIYTVED